MTASRIDIPCDAVLGDWAARLDPARVLEVGREQLTHIESDIRASWQACRMIEALYHPGRYLRIAYVLLSAPSTPQRRQWPEGQIVYLHAPVRRPISRRGVELRIDDATVEAYCFPNDRRLRGMRKFAGKRDAVATWQRWIDEAAGGFAIDADSLQRLLVRYVPEQKWVIRLRAEGTSRDTGRTRKRRIAVRAARGESCARLLDRHRTLAAWARCGDGSLIVPDVVGADIADGLLAVEWIRGETLVETLQQNDPGEVLEQVARTLSLWHTAPLDGLPSLKRDALVQNARDAATDLGAACPPLCARLDALAAEIDARLGAAADSEPVTLHNDFHWNQLRIKPGRFAVLDLERMARGDPLVDVANFATQLRMLGLRDAAGVDAATAEKWSGLFLDRWAAVTGRAVDADRFRVYAVVSLLELARGMMRHLREGWRELAEACVQRGESELAAGARQAVSP